MGKVLVKMTGWLKVSNRPAHMKMGFIVFVLTLLFSLSLLTAAEGQFDVSQILADRLMIVNLLQADWCVLGCMCAVEFAQKLCGNKFDWLDIAAGFLIPFVLTIILTLVILIV